MDFDYYRQESYHPFKTISIEFLATTTKKKNTHRKPCEQINYFNFKNWVHFIWGKRTRLRNTY